MKRVLGIIGKIISNIVIVILSIVLLLAIYNLINIRIIKKDYTNLFGYTYFDIITGSMVDTINIDDYVFVKITKDVKENDIISFKYDGDIVTHRIIEINDKEIITKGDANNTIDNPITKDDVIGKVIHVGRGFGLVSKTIMSPMVLVSLIVTIVLFGIYFSMKES